MVTAVVDAFLNPALRSLFADLTPRAMRGRVMALLGGGGLNLMRGVYAASILGKIFQTSGTFLSGYVYSFDNSLPWLILSASMAVIGVVFFVLVKDPQMPEV